MKIITSPIKRWAGTVQIADPLTQAQAHEIEKATDLISEFRDTLKEGEKYKISQVDDIHLPAILACVEKWELADFTLPFPYSPRLESHNLIEWLFREILAVYVGDLKIPNE